MKPASQTAESIFGEAIYTYTRAQAIEDGELVDLSTVFPDLVANAGIKFPVACTRAVFDRYIELTPAAKRACNDIKGRAWDVLYMLRCAIKASRIGGPELTFGLRVVTDRLRPSLVSLKSVCGPGDAAEPVITIMLLDQD